jgi:hypothetical protein
MTSVLAFLAIALIILIAICQVAALDFVGWFIWRMVKSISADLRR